jgi:molecular chaperone DnaK (HSP70)
MTRLVGIDLGTTNSAVAWLDRSSKSARPRPRLFEILQLVGPSETARRPTQPSFLYFPTAPEQAAGGLGLPWNPRPHAIVGAFARDHGALVPTRQVSSSKSWLSNAAVDRRAAILPWGAHDGPTISPVGASALLLAHLRDAWNDAHGEQLRLEDQEIVLTVPASFDEEARELTVEAAREAGFDRVSLLEEPLAAVYAWIASHARERASRLTDGRLLLVCDVGGGTTDFSLIRATAESRQIRFERTAIGEHLLLGGDNVDIALAARVERTLIAGAPSARIGVVERQMLRRQCSAAKERLLAPDGPERIAITILGSGRGVVGGAITAELTREEALATLLTFLPVVSRTERPHAPDVRRGLRELGLPYESDPAITRHLAAFLAGAARTDPSQTRERRAEHGADTLARPDAVLFNGGFFTPEIARERILDTLAAWFGDRPAVLTNDAPDAAVAIGAAFYAHLRSNPAAAARLLIRAGTPRSYYVAVQAHHAPESADRAASPPAGAARSIGRRSDLAVCIMPRGTQEGTQLTLDRDFTVVANRPAAFTLLSSTVRTDAPGALVSVDRDEEMHRHAPLVTALRYGKRSRHVAIRVRLTLVFTAVGTLELWCEAHETDHRWRLQFNLRGIERANDPDEDAEDDEAAPDEIVVADESVAAAERMIRDAFATAAGAPSMAALVGDLEQTLGHAKASWPLPVIRRLADVLLAVVEARQSGEPQEARWLNLTGFCMRPGFGAPADPWRIGELRKVYAAGLAHPKDIQCQVEWLILWQRVSSGFSAGQQQELASRLATTLGIGAKKVPHANPQILRESWRLLASLERLNREQRTRFGDELVARLRRESRNASMLWAVGRIGARVPLYGPLSSVVPPLVAERWLEALFAIEPATDERLAAAAQLVARTDDPVRDVSDGARESVIARLVRAGASPEVIRPVREPVAPDRMIGARLFGESLPEGLSLEPDRDSVAH